MDTGSGQDQTGDPCVTAQGERAAWPWLNHDRAHNRVKVAADATHVVLSLRAATGREGQIAFAKCSRRRDMGTGSRVATIGQVAIPSPPTCRRLRGLRSLPKLDSEL